VRYNISQNDATATFTFESDAAADSLVHNNTLYARPGLTVELVRNTFGAPHGILFVNNILCIAGQALRCRRAAGGTSGATRCPSAPCRMWGPTRPGLHGDVLHRAPLGACGSRCESTDPH